MIHSASPRGRPSAWVAAVIAVLVLGGPVLAGADYWKAAVSGEFGDNARWLDGSAPGPGDSANFTVPGTYRVEFWWSDVTNQDLFVTQGDIQFESPIEDRTYYLTSGGGRSVDISGGRLVASGMPNRLNLYVGDLLRVRGGGYLAVGRGTATAYRLEVGTTPSGAESELRLTNSATLNVLGTDGAYVGRAGAAGRLTFLNQARGSIAGSLHLATSGAGSTGFLTVESGAQVDLAHLFVGAEGISDQQGTVTVSGTGSQIRLAAGTSVHVGADSGSAGTITIDSDASFHLNGGGLYINPTGQVNVNGGLLNLGSCLAVQGGAFLQQAGYVGCGAGVEIRVSGGGQARFSQSLILPPGGWLDVTERGSRCEITGDNLAIASGARVTVRDGGLVQAPQWFTVGTSGHGEVVVEGAGSRLTAGAPMFGYSFGFGGYSGSVTFRDRATGLLDGGVYVAGDAEAGTVGTLLIESGARLEAASLAIAMDGGGAVGTVRVTGADSRLDHLPGAVLTLGTAGGLARLEVLDGAAYDVGDAGSTVLNPSGLLRIDRGTVSLGALAQNGGRVEFTSGSLDFIGDLDVGFGGLLGENVTLTSQHVLSLTGQTVVAHYRTLLLDGGDMTSGSLMDHGTVSVSRGRLALLGTGHVAPTGRLFIGSAGTVYAAGRVVNEGRTELLGGAALLTGDDVLDNQGLLVGDGEVALGLVVSPGGEVRAENGKRLFFSSPSPAGNDGRIVLQGGTAQFTGGLVNAAEGLIAGRGTLIAGGAGLTNTGSPAFSAGLTDLFGDVLNAGTGRVVTSGGGTTTFWDDVVHNGAEIRTSVGCRTVFLGSVSGSGPFTGTGTVYFEGDLSPGSSPGAVRFEGDLVLGAAAALLMELAGPTPGAEYDVLDVAGDLYVGGTLTVALLDGFAPRAGEAFTLFRTGGGTLHGTFGALALPDLGGGLAWDAAALYTTGGLTVVPEPGALSLLALGSLALAGRRRSHRG